jgi:hypothetical protein
MAEETLAFYVLVIPVMIAARYDAVTGVAIILVGAGIGVLGSTINPFATNIASNAAGIPFTTGRMLRFIILGAGWVDSLPATDLARYLIGGVAVQDLPFKPEGMAGIGRLEDAAGIPEGRAGTLVSRS